MTNIPGKDEQQYLETLARPLMLYLSDNFHPHVKIVLDSTGVELVEGLRSYNTKDFIRD